MYYWYIGMLFEMMFVIHAIKRGHGYGWVFIILAFPGLGCAVYFIMVVVPEMRGSRAVTGAASSVMKTIDPKRDLRRHMEDLQSTGSIANKAKLADECLTQGMNDEAIRLYNESLFGAFKDDPHLIFGLASAYYRSGKFDEAVSTIEKLRDITKGKLSDEAKLLHTLSLEGKGDVDAALEAYASIVPSFTGPEAKCHYGMLLAKAGQEEKAKSVFQEIVLTAKRSPSFYRRLHKQSITIAKKYA